MKLRLPSHSTEYTVAEAYWRTPHRVFTVKYHADTRYPFLDTCVRLAYANYLEIPASLNFSIEKAQ